MVSQEKGKRRWAVAVLVLGGLLTSPVRGEPPRSPKPTTTPGQTTSDGPRAVRVTRRQRTQNKDLLRIPRSQLYSRFFTTIPQDLGEITFAPFRYPEWGAWFFGGSALFVLIDKPVTQVWQDVMEENLTFPLPTLIDTPITQRSDGYLLLGLGAYYLGSLALGDRRGEVAVALSFKAITYSYLYAHLVLKTLFARNRPHFRLGDPTTYTEPFTDNPYDFFNFHPPYFSARPEGTAFPSFHWTMFFSVSRVLSRVYDSYWPYLIAAVGLGVDTEFQRHWVSDMFAGGVLGVLIADVIYDNYMGVTGSDKTGFFADARILPTTVPGGAGVVLTKRF